MRQINKNEININKNEININVSKNEIHNKIRQFYLILHLT